MFKTTRTYNVRFAKEHYETINKLMRILDIRVNGVLAGREGEVWEMEIEANKKDIKNLMTGLKEFGIGNVIY